MDRTPNAASNPTPGLGGQGAESKGIRSKVHFSTEAALSSRYDSIASGGTGEESETSGGEHVVDFDTPREGGVHYYRSSSSSDDDEDEEEFAAGYDQRRGRRSPFITATSVFGDGSGRTLPVDDPYHSHSDPEELGGDVGDGEGARVGHGRKRWRRKKESRERAPEQQITIFALRLALIEKTASGLGTLSFLWATVVILGGFATTVNETDFWVVTLIILAESSRIFSRSHELEWQQLSFRSHESLAHRFFRAASSSYEHNVTFAKALRRNIKSCFHSHARRGSEGGQADTETTTSSTAAAEEEYRPQPTRRRTSRKSTTKPSAAHEMIKETERKTKDQTRTWNTPSVQLLPYTHHLVTTKLVSRVLYAVQLLSAVMSIALAIWRLINQDFFYNPDNNQPKPPNITVSMNVFYILSVVEAGMFLIERVYWEYRIRVTELVEKVNNEAELGPENLVTVRQFFYDVYSQCLKGSVLDGLELDLVSFSISWLQAEDFEQQLGGARLLNRIVSCDDGKPRKDRFAADCLRRLGTTPGIIERLVEMLSWNGKQEEPLLSHVAVIVCRLVVYNRNCSRIVAIPGSIEGIVNLLLPHHWPSPEDKPHYSKQTKAVFDLRINGLRILKYFCKDHKNCLRIGETKGLLPILILFIEVRSRKAFEEISNNDRTNHDKIPTFSYQLKTIKKSLQVIGLLAATTDTSGGLLRRRIADVVSGLKNLRDVIEFGDSQPELQRSSVEIMFHLAMDPELRKTIGATGGIIRNLYNLFASYDEINFTRQISQLTADQSKKSLVECQLASEMAGKTLSRLVLQNDKNSLKLISMKSEREEPFLKCMIRFLAKPLETPNPAPREIASCSAQILRSVISYVDDGLRRQIAEDSIRGVLLLIKKRLLDGRSSLYESYLGLASRIISPVSYETYTQVFGTVISKSELALQFLKNLKHTPSTNRFPKIRRYCLELLIDLTIKDAEQQNSMDGLSRDNSFLNIFGSRNINIIDVLHSTLDSISEVENFCVFSGSVGYARHSEDMEVLVLRAIEYIQSLDKRAQDPIDDHHP